MKTKSNPTVSAVIPTEDDVREYAYHLYVQSGCQVGHDLDNWLEAKACLCASIPTAESHTRLHRQTQKYAAIAPVSA